jgi:hypothetical protein
MLRSISREGGDGSVDSAVVVMVLSSVEGGVARRGRRGRRAAVRGEDEDGAADGGG